MMQAALMSRPALIVPEAPPVAAFLRGKSAEEVVELLPRLFNICPAAQRMAAHLALGMPVGADLHAALRAEVIRDHLIKLCLDWPKRLGTGGLDDALSQPLGTVTAALMGSPPATLEELQAGNSPLSQMARAVEHSFPQSVATTPDLGDSAAGRWTANPLLASIAARYGTGPLWRVIGRAVELQALAEGWQPQASAKHGVAHVTAARGLYTLSVTLEAGRVASLIRITPTDRMLVPEGSLTQSAKQVTTGARGPLLISLYDPCTPVQFRRRDGHA